MSVRIVTLLDGYSGSDSAEEYSRDRTLILTGESDESKLYTVTDATTGYRVPSIGTVHPTFRGMVLRGRDPERITKDQWRIRLRYAGAQLSPGGTTNTNEIRYRWEIGQRTEQRDYDIYDKPLIDAAGFPVADKFPFTDCTMFLKVWRQEDDFDVPTAFQLMRRTNSKRMYVFNRWWFDPGQMMLWTYSPEKDQRLGNTSTENLYVFEFRPGLRPFQPRWKNAGLNAWASTTEGGPICYSSGDAVSDPIPFSLTGIPNMGTTNLKVKKTDGAIAAIVANTSITNAISRVTKSAGTGSAHATEPGSNTAYTYQWTFDEWVQFSGTANETRLLSQDFYKETDFRGLIPGIL